MAKILVVDDEAVVREPIAASLRAAGHEVACAAGGREALAQVRSQAPDLMLLDIVMPERDGLAVLRELRSYPGMAHVPVLLLSAATERSVIVQAASLGVQGYILKSAFSLGELLERVRKLTAEQPQAAPPAAAAQRAVKRAGGAGGKAGSPANAMGGANRAPDVSAWPRVLTRDQVLARLDHVAGGKTLAGVVAQLVAVANSPRADMADVVQVIQSDPILASRVLQLANSAAAGSRARVRNVEEAARNLGVRGVQNLAISVGICDAFPPEERDGFNTMRCWQHSYAVADLLGVLVCEADHEHVGMNHLIGLCHDLGEILLRQHFTAEYEQIVGFAMEHQLAVQEVQTVALGIRQPELTSRLLSRMGLPAAVVHPIREFYERQVKGQSAGASTLAQALSLANSAAHGLLLAATPHETVRPVTRTEWRQFTLTRPPPVIDAQARRQEVLTATGILARLPAGEEQRLLVPPVARTTRRIWYVRPEMFVEFDPLALALSLLGELTISTALPEGPQWRETDNLVLAGSRPGVPPVLPEKLAQAAAAAGRSDLPMLAVVLASSEKGAAHEAAGKLEIRCYPITLEELGTWLAAAEGK